MEDLKIGRIYYLKSSQTDDIYVGSTRQKLKDRFINHKSDYKNKKINQNNSSFELMKYDDVYCELIKEVICSKNKLLELEREEIKRNVKAVNILIPGNVIKFDDYKEYKKEYDKIYQKNNCNKLKDYYKLKIKCECECFYTYKNKARHIKSKIHQKYLSNISI